MFAHDRTLAMVFLCLWLREAKLGLSTSCSVIFWQLSVFGATFFVSRNVLHSEHFSLVLDQFWNIWAALSAQNWPCFHTSQCFSKKFMKFLWKRSQILPPLPRWGRSWAQSSCSRAARSAVFFWRKFEMADEDSYLTDTNVSGEVKKVVLTTTLLAHTIIFTTLILILLCGLWSPDYAAKLH